MRRALCFLIIAAVVSIRIVGADESFLPANPALHASGKEVPHDTLAGDDLGAPKVALVTFGPGRIYWERFGHNALIVDDPATDERITYNYGVFDFQEQHFLRNFALGHMQYSLVAEPLDADLETYAAEGRSVTVQMLNLTAAQARQLAAFLAWNVQPQNADYRYDYFLNNCSTKVRDALNRALDGVLNGQLARRPASHTYRFDAVRRVSADFWFALGMDLGLGPKADRPLSLWQESFIPAVLSRALRDVAVRDNNGHTVPLVSDEEVVLRGGLPQEAAAPFELGLPFLTAGVGLAALLLWLARGTGRRYRASFSVLALAWWLLCGFSGLVLFGLWEFSDHWAAWDNENLLLVDPLCLILPLVWRRAPRIARALITLIAALAVISLIVRALPGMYQDNLAFIALALPVHLVLAVLAWQQRAVAEMAEPREARAHERFSS